MMSDPSMTCDAVTAMLPAYLANTLDEHAAEAIERHVSICAVCEVRLERATRVELAAFAPTVPTALRERVLAAIPVAPSAAPRRWRGPVAALATLAAAAALYVSTTRGTSRRTDRTTADAIVSARALAAEQAASEFRSLDEAARELEQAIKAAPDDRDMRAYLDAVQARRAELSEKIAEAAS